MPNRIEGEEAMELFKVVAANNLLPQKLEDLVPLSFIGQAAVSFYRGRIKLMDELKMTDEQRKATLSDGQDAGEMLLDIEARIGELSEKEEKAKTKSLQPSRGTAGHFDGGGAIPSGQPPKHERLGLPRMKMRNAQAIHKNPDIVEKIKAEAKKNEDIPTKTAVLSEIRYQNEKKRKKKAEGKRQKNGIIIAVEQLQYISALDKCIRHLPQKPPKDWNDAALKEAKAKAKIIIRRLEVFND